MASKMQQFLIIKKTAVVTFEDTKTDSYKFNTGNQLKLDIKLGLSIKVNFSLNSSNPVSWSM